MAVNPILPAVAWFRTLWSVLPAPLHGLFYVSLALLVFWGSIVF